jgi:predicted nuclease of predicted toxin-antitoxin system
LADWIGAQDHDAQHVAALGMATASDQAIWDVALAKGAVVVTKDHGFVEWATIRRPAPSVVWIRIGNATTVALIARLEAVWDRVLQSLEAGAQVVEASGP